MDAPKGLVVDAWVFVLVTISIPVALYVAGTRQESFDEKTGAFVAVAVWFGLAWLMGWGAGIVDDRTVPYAEQAAHHAHHADEFALVVLWMYISGIGFLITAIAVAIGCGAGWLMSPKHEPG